VRVAKRALVCKQGAVSFQVLFVARKLQTPGGHFSGDPTGLEIAEVAPHYFFGYSSSVSCPHFRKQHGDEPTQR